MSLSVKTPGLLTLPEVAAELRLSERQVRRLIALGKIPAVRLGDPGASIRVAREDLERWLYGDPEGVA
jgi:excisionase family DNA binding protein